MTGPLLLRQVMLLRFRLQNYQRFAAGIAATPHRLWCCAATDPDSSQDNEKVSTAADSSNLLKAYSRFDEPDYRKWKNKEKEILEDIEPILMLTKEILHSRRYKDGERLTVEDEKSIVENLLAYHPRCEDKIGCGLESIMVDRHPQFRHSRCLFVVRTDGGWIDFSYQKCLREYIRNKYPSLAERFIRENFKRGSG
ncbi:hypothetical protein L6164_024626 [Bauhinia variegata]|uniref:Uncharacterized protein n=1 Tax=Bauhinia variegata TaxID=167791 RepID=A0ACB9M161_BAUVA|nr:hypothetical protein L6164_024626 [Bauhinia variegata]